MTVTPFRAGTSAASGPGMRAALAELLTAPVFTGTYTLLADISEFQPDISDAVYLKWSPAIVIRAAYGDAHDDHAWYGGARRKALHDGGAKFLGIYQYLVAGQDGTAQADALHDLVGPFQPHEVLIADFEEGQHAMLTAWYNRMINWYPARYLWTYSGLNFGADNGALPVEWLAAYQQTEPTSPHTLWQFTGNFTVPGVGNADCSVFHGTADELASLAFVKDTAAPVPTPTAPAPPPSELRQDLKSAGSVVSFTWGPVPGVTKFSFQLEWWKPGFGWVLTVDTNSVTGQAYSMTLKPATRYRWRVSGGTWTSWVGFDTP